MNEKCLLDFKKCNGDWRNINNQACPTPFCRFCLAAVIILCFPQGHECKNNSITDQMCRKIQYLEE